MKRFKLILLLLVGVIAVCNFTACKDDDDKQETESTSGSNSIVGSWEYYGNGGKFYYCYTFKANGEFNGVWSEDGKQGSDSGTYTYNGKTLILRYSDGETETYTVTISGNQAILTDEYGSTVYTRK